LGLFQRPAGNNLINFLHQTHGFFERHHNAQIGFNFGNIRAKRVSMVSSAGIENITADGMKNNL
jgi:hypothetical protein